MLLDPQYFDFAISFGILPFINIMQISLPIEEHLYECNITLVQTENQTSFYSFKRASV
jgi:hypothetical protein